MSIENQFYTSEGSVFYEWFHDIYESSFCKLNEALTGNLDLNFRLFDVRLNNALGTRISLDPAFRYAETESAREVARLTLRLSNIWFCYEALLSACRTSNLLKNPKSKVDCYKEDIIAELNKNYDFDDVMLEFWGMSGNIVDEHSKYRIDLQKYVSYLERGATSTEQKTFLLRVYNKFTNNDQFAIQEALALVYAIRNQYVHAGEAPKSGVDHYSTKIAILKSSHDFMTLFCLRLGTLLIDKMIIASPSMV